MKKILTIIFLLSFAILAPKSFAAPETLTFEQAISNKKPLFVLIYADWADNAQQALTNFNYLKTTKGSNYNFLPINLASKETKEYLKYSQIGQDIPYMVMFKKNATVIRYIPGSCVIDQACISKKIDILAR